MPSPRLSRPRTAEQQEALERHQRESAVRRKNALTLERNEARYVSSVKRPSLLKRLFSSKKSLKQPHIEEESDEDESGGGKKIRTRRKIKAHRKKTYRKRK